jgi:hypothetical protein
VRACFALAKLALDKAQASRQRELARLVASASPA